MMQNDPSQVQITLHRLGLKAHEVLASATRPTMLRERWD